MALALEAQAESAAELLSAIANPRRLVVLCHLVEGERTVGELTEIAGLSQSAMSQHLARMRALGLVATRRAGQSIYYRLASPELREVITTLHRIYCMPPAGPGG
jgi:DNA-binding transcriptional ArsR family regulator